MTTGSQFLVSVATTSAVPGIKAYG